MGPGQLPLPRQARPTCSGATGARPFRRPPTWAPVCWAYGGRAWWCGDRIVACGSSGLSVWPPPCSACGPGAAGGARGRSSTTCPSSTTWCSPASTPCSDCAPPSCWPSSSIARSAPSEVLGPVAVGRPGPAARPRQRRAGPGRPVGSAAAVAVAVVALAPDRRRPRPQPAPGRAAGDRPRLVPHRRPNTSPPGQVLLTYPFATADSQSSIPWQAIGGMHYQMAGGGGPAGTVARAGADRAGFERPGPGLGAPGPGAGPDRVPTSRPSARPSATGG